MITPETRLPLISVYIPTRNRPSLLDRAVRSVLDQDYQNLEIIIVDDASDQAVYNKWNDQRIRIINNHMPLGAPASRNLAICAASGEFITGLDDDDFFLPTRLSGFLEAWRNLRVASTLFPIAGLFDSSLVLRRRGSIPVIRHQQKIVGFQELKRMATIGNQIFTPTSRLKECGGFDTNMPAWQDLELWCRFSRSYGYLFNIEKCSIVVDESHGSSRITTSDNAAIRKSLDIFSHKVGLSTPEELSHPIVFALYYKAFVPRFSDVATLLAARRFRQARRALSRLLQMNVVFANRRFFSR